MNRYLKHYFCINIQIVMNSRADIIKKVGFNIKKWHKLLWLDDVEFACPMLEPKNNNLNMFVPKILCTCTQFD